jgi:hypothetical protein
MEEVNVEEEPAFMEPGDHFGYGVRGNARSDEALDFQNLG